METIETDDSLPDGWELAEVLVIAAVTWPTPERPDGAGNSTYYRCTSPFPWVQKGLLGETGRAIDRSSMPYDEDEDDDGG